MHSVSSLCGGATSIFDGIFPTRVCVFVQLFVVTRHRHNTPSGGCEWEGIRWHLLKYLLCVFQYLHACLCFCVFVLVFVHLFVITGHRQVVGSGTMAKPLAQGAASLETVTLPLLLLHLYMHCSPIQYEYMI